ncbi:F0F1 ATP synthase subunit gamma, partial [Patescibacteria group bacterium]|nr:F0F1 ATP synthase subunit gamma [Patescibacteria group bacterium]
GKTVNVFLSANEHLYGTLILDVWGHFVNDVSKGDSDAIVIGSFGKYLINNENLDVEFTYFDLEDDKPGADQIKKIVDFLGKYEKVVVYHGQMISVLNQVTAKSEITGGISLMEKVQKRVKRYLFEPSSEKILEFFEGEIIGALFNQSVLEHQLARFAARMVAMDQASENADEELKKTRKTLRSLHRRILNRKQLEVYAGYHNWSQAGQSRKDSIESEVI